MTTLAALLSASAALSADLVEALASDVLALLKKKDRRVEMEATDYTKQKAFVFSVGETHVLWIFFDKKKSTVSYTVGRKLKKPKTVPTAAGLAGEATPHLPKQEAAVEKPKAAGAPVVTKPAVVAEKPVAGPKKGQSFVEWVLATQEPAKLAVAPRKSGPMGFVVLVGPWTLPGRKALSSPFEGKAEEREFVEKAYASVLPLVEKTVAKSVGRTSDLPDLSWKNVHEADVLGTNASFHVRYEVYSDDDMEMGYDYDSDEDY